jgi:Notch-like protein
VTVTVMDDGEGSLTHSETLWITVKEVNVAPVLDSIGNQTVDEQSMLTFTASASDQDDPADGLFFSLDSASLGSGMSINASSGVFEWIPDIATGGKTYYVTLTATDEGFLADNHTFAITVVVVNVPPVFDALALSNHTVNEGAQLTFVITADDPDLPHDQLMFTLDPPLLGLGMTLDPIAGAFVWTPSESQGGEVYEVIVTVTDTGNMTDSVVFRITVNEVNSAPLMESIGNRATAEQATLNFTVVAFDHDKPTQNITYTIDQAAMNLGMSMDARAGIFAWKLKEVHGGEEYNVTITASDDDSTDPMNVSETIVITVAEVNTGPVIAVLVNQTVEEQHYLEYNISAFDSDQPAHPLTFSLDDLSLAEGMSINPDSGEFTWYPSEAQGGFVYSATVLVSDGALEDNKTFAIQVQEVNVPPVWEQLSNQTIDEHDTLTFSVFGSAFDQDDPAQALSFSVDAASSELGVTIDSQTGDIQWSTKEEHGPHVYAVEVTATDGSLNTTQEVYVTVYESNVAPVLQIQDDEYDVLETHLLEFSVNATDEDLPPQTLTYTLDQNALELEAAIDPETGEFAWTPDSSLGGAEYTIEIFVTDNNNSSGVNTGPSLQDSISVLIRVENVNTPPELHPVVPQTVQEFDLLTFSASGFDVDSAQPLTYTLGPGALDGMEMTVEGSFSWTPNETYGGTEVIAPVGIHDGQATVYGEVPITVVEVNSAPQLDPFPALSTAEGELVSTIVTATDPDEPANNFTFSLDLVSLSQGMTVEPTTGKFQWTPGEDAGDSNYSVTITVTDDGEPPLSASIAFSVVVSDVNNAPVFVGLGDQTIGEDSPFEYLVLARDEDLPANSLVYRLDQAPDGMQIDNTSGLIEWSPNEEHGGQEFLVTVTVTDDGAGRLSSQGSFTVTVTETHNAPVMVPRNYTIDELTPLQFTVQASDSDLPLQDLAYSLDEESLAAGMEIDPASGVFNWISPEAQFQEYRVSITVVDTSGLSTSEIFVITVQRIDECASEPCLFGAPCSDGVSGYTCECLAGYAGPTCGVDVDDCATSPCQNGGTCVDGIDSFNCACEPGYAGSDCAENIDDCADDPCDNGGTCKDGVNSFFCECPEGFFGHDCSVRENNCEDAACGNDGECVSEIGGYTCICAAGWTGDDCEDDVDECASFPCENGAQCENGANEFVCTCPDGFVGVTCGTNVDECEPEPCQNEGQCIDGIAAFECNCLPGWEGDTCGTNVDECASQPCLNGGSCRDGSAGYECMCEDGFGGAHCGNNVDECASQPCQNDAECRDTINGYRCVCQSGFIGDHCDEQIDECVSSPCQNDGECEDQLNSYVCNCPLGYELEHCQWNTNDCASNPCQNGADCVDGVASYVCQCRDGFTGSTCAINIDECADDPCGAHGFCVDAINSYVCECDDGFSGANCEVNNDECASAPCQADGTCEDQDNGFVCACVSGYTGRVCEVNIDDCENTENVCQNDGECVDGIDSIICSCPEFYVGTYCESFVSACSADTCQNGGECISLPSSYECKCPPGFDGFNCEINIDDCLVAQCVNGICEDLVGDYKCHCSEGYEGAYCDIDIDDCDPDPCENGICSDQVHCTCK